MTDFLDRMNAFVWGVPALILILCAGLFLTIRTRFSQIRLFKKALCTVLETIRNPRRQNGNMSPFQTLCAALAATVGTGNIAGVAGAIALGGPGAIFWMWVSGLLGMILKFAEAVLAVRFQQTDSNGQLYGGPMYMIEHGMGKRWKWLANIYCFLGIAAAFGVGNATQINAVIDSFHSAASGFGGNVNRLSDLSLGILLAAFAGYLLLGGSTRIGAAAEKLVPISACAYVALGLGVIILKADMIPEAFRAILTGAFSPKAVTGGAIGSAFLALRTGISRGVFTNEAGMGTASIAYASARSVHPVEQGLLGIIEVFVDTIVICTVTALAILCSNVFVPYGADQGAALTAQAFASVYGSWVTVPLTLFLCAFAFATILGWGLYGIRCAQYLFQKNIWIPFVIFQIIFIVLSAILKTETVWLLAEIMNGLMAIPNLIAVLYLSPLFIELISEYSFSTSFKKIPGGTYENFNQRKPLRTFSHEKIPSSCHGSREKG